MATWGAYFSSYVKKTSDPKQVELEELNEKELLGKSSEAPKRIESGSSQKSVKKLYDLVEEPQSYQPKRSASNAARVAKMFGYGTPAPEAEVKVESVAPIATWTKIEPVAPLSFKKVETAPTPAQPVAVPSFMKRFETKITPVPAPTPAPAPVPKKVENKALPAPPPKPKTKQDIFAMLDDFASFADNPDAIQILPDLPAKKPAVTELRLETKNILPQKENRPPAPARKDSFWSDTDSPASYRSSRKDSFQSQMSQIETPASSVSSMSFRKDSFRGQASPLLSRPKLVVSKNPISLEPSDDFRARMMEFERQSDELMREQKRRDEEREQILKYERMQDQMRYEREKMDMEREKMMEEQRKFQEEADRIAEEEKQMAQFMKSFQVEMERDRDNEERKRRAAEEAERERQRAIEAEERRIQEEEKEEQRRQQAEMEAEERRRLEEEEAEERRLQAIRDKEEEERELREYEERRAQRQREADEKERRLRLKDERLAQEEADRLTALALRKREAQEADRRRNQYEQELEADRRRFEEEEEEERLRAEEEEIERERQRRFIAERAERERYEQEEAERERQRARDERIEAQRQVAQERAERAQFEEDEARRIAQENADRRFEEERRQQEEEEDDDRPLTKEEEMQRAEEKIRQAFAGLAKEKGQNAQPMQRSNIVAIQMPRPIAPVKNYANGMTPAGRESRVYKGEPEQPKADRVLGRNNTIAAFGAKPAPQKRPGVLQKPPRAPGGSVGNIGLPGGPRSGLPSGPGPRRNQTTRR
ncbi:hypothetical protein N431DRAFT_483462 [Stipitochalara longipes BDJ]|nr:hypothetical protein N431DRAFT_483462 [Stipitochalara longipes BDJ]